MRSAELLSSE